MTAAKHKTEDSVTEENALKILQDTYRRVGRSMRQDLGLLVEGISDALNSGNCDAARWIFQGIEAFFVCAYQFSVAESDEEKTRVNIRNAFAKGEIASARTMLEVIIQPRLTALHNDAWEDMVLSSLLRSRFPEKVRTVN